MLLYVLTLSTSVVFVPTKNYAQPLISIQNILISFSLVADKDDLVCFCLVWATCLSHIHGQKKQTNKQKTVPKPDIRAFINLVVNYQVERNDRFRRHWQLQLRTNVCVTIWILMLRYHREIGLMRSCVVVFVSTHVSLFLNVCLYSCAPISKCFHVLCV